MPASHSPRSAPRVLIVLHQEHSTPGRVGRLLEEMGATLDIRRPRFGDPLPASMADHQGAIIFGGPMSANDPDDFVREEIDWIGVPLKEDKPFLGICLGAQMLVKKLGGRVDYHPEGWIEAGYYPILPTGSGLTLADEIGAAWPRLFYQWHREGVECPAGCEILALGEAFPQQAFRVGRRAYGIQFHPEVTYAMMCRWTVRAAARLELPGARPAQEHLEGWRLNDAAVDAWIRAFLGHWLAGESKRPGHEARAHRISRD
jgi:GMP synthase (glutamine-hydrolysing)